MKNILFFAMLLSISGYVFSETTNKTTIKTVLYNGTADYLWFTSNSGWVVKDSSGNTLCTPYYVQVTSSIAGRDKLLSIGLAAKMARSEVDFIGNCTTDPNYFNAYYIRVY
jgi:hypothetical protein